VFAMLSLAVISTAVTTGPSCTIHVRDLTVPERVVSVPLTGAETVSDAVESLKRTPKEFAGMDLWLARPGENGKVRLLPIDWSAIATRGIVTTNYQLLTGDRLFVQSRPAK
jgi:polysaccharide biosynthesis/export protein